MTKFDEMVERKEEIRAQKKNEEWNAWLLSSLKSRTKEEVLRSMYALLVIPVGSKTILQGNRTAKELVH